LEGKQISFHRFVVDECLPTIQGSFERVKTQRIHTTFSSYFRGLTFEFPLEGKQISFHRFVVDVSWTNVSLLYRVPLKGKNLLVSLLSVVPSEDELSTFL
jgi:hypothetical protein